ncbi:LOW QUALITY PROTEIN: putative inorganic phosphate cotransporter [Bacillus rossius redtenbacheri]|uniref:LOW QUALITY PROTEIN: putative inorganic phosphate cotransporter n=1 Tax=Bacillus rossius redtenbacheri TaxID=93214 RepID=UPI002FDDA62C
MLSGWRKLLATVCLPQRYVFAIMGFLAIANAYTMRICLSVAITEMVAPRNKSAGSLSYDPDACPSDPVTNSSVSSAGTFAWSEKTQGLILSSFYWGYVISHLPGGLLAERFGGKYCLGLGILWTAVFTLLTPLTAAWGGASWLLGLRFLEGLGEGPTFPAINAMLAQWAPPTERSRIGSIVFSGSLVGTVVGTALSGALLHYSSWGWPSVFYMFGLLGVLWFLFWVALCYNDPASHPFISDHEKKYIAESVGSAERSKDMLPIPWRGIFTSVPMWGLIVAQIGHDWGFFTMVTDLPKYMNDVMKFNIAQNGYLSSIPYIAMWVASIAFGVVADWLIARRTLSITNTRKIFTTIASVGPAAGIILASYAGCDRTAVVALFTAGWPSWGAFYPGMKVNALDLSPNYAGTLMAVVNGIGALSGIVTPYLVGVLTPNSTMVQWRMVFWVSFAVFLITNLVFVITASGDTQIWNDSAPNDEENVKEKNHKTRHDQGREKQNTAL